MPHVQRLCFCLPDISYIKAATVMRPAYPLFSRKYYTDLYYSTLTPLLSDAPTRYSFLSLRPKMTPDEHKCRGRDRERERERQVTARCNCFFFFPSCFIFFFSFFFRSLSFLFRVFFFRPPLLEVHAIVTRKCKMRMACSDAFVLVGRMIETRPGRFLHRWNTVIVALLHLLFT